MTPVRSRDVTFTYLAPVVQKIVDKKGVNDGACTDKGLFNSNDAPCYNASVSKDSSFSAGQGLDNRSWRMIGYYRNIVQERPRFTILR